MAADADVDEGRMIGFVGNKNCLLLKIIRLLPWSWKDRICSQTSKSDWRFGSGGENRHLQHPAMNWWLSTFLSLWFPGRISKTSSCQTWEGAVGLRVASRSFSRKVVLSGGPTMRESCAVRIQAVKATSQRVNESTSQRAPWHRHVS